MREQNSSLNENEIMHLRKELRMTRIFCMISSVITFCLLAGMILLFNSLRPIYDFLEKAEPILEEASMLDVDTLNDTLEQVNTSLEQVDWEELSRSLSQLDVKSINEALENLDTEEFSEALENLNEAADTLKGLGEKWQSFSSLF